MATLITKNSSTTTSVPIASQLVQGELAVNVTDKRLFTENSGGSVVELGTNPSSLTLESGTANGVAYLNGSKVLTTGSSLVFDGSNLGLGTTSPTQTLDVNGNVAITGSARRITGDFSNATVANRIAFQSSTTNGNTIVGAIPNGTGVTSVFRAFNAADPTNSGQATIGITTSIMVVESAISGTGTYVPMTFSTSGSEKLRIAADTTGTYTFGGTAPRITGDFSNATITNRVAFQTSTVNGNTSISFVPNGTAIVSQLALYGNSDVTTNYQLFDMITNGTVARLRQLSAGTAAYLPMTFETGGSERMRISSSGAVAIGHVVPSATLDVSGSSWVRGSASAGAVLTMTADATSGATGVAIGASFVTGGYGPIRFFTGGAEQMRLDASGNLLVGATSAGGYKFNVEGGASTASLLKSTGVCSDMWSTPTSGNNTFVAFYTEASATLRGSISYNRAGGLVAYNVTSDYRAKDISGPVVNSGALIDSVPVYMGKMKEATQERPMFIAHEVPAYAHTGVKDAVDADGKPVYQQMDASALIPVMWAEIQDLRKRLAAAGI